MTLIKGVDDEVPDMEGGDERPCYRGPFKIVSMNGTIAYLESNDNVERGEVRIYPAAGGQSFTISHDYDHVDVLPHAQWVSQRQDTWTQHLRDMEEFLLDYFFSFEVPVELTAWMKRKVAGRLL